MSGAVKSITSAGAKLVGSFTGATQAADAAQEAANVQAGIAREGAANTEKWRDQFITWMNPYRQAGDQALGQFQALSGSSGDAAQQQAIQAVQNSPILKALIGSGENSILQNASATGGLRGGNVNEALAKYSPAMLNQEIQQRLANYGSLVNSGQNAAQIAGSAGLNASQIVNAMNTQAGAAQAGGIMAEGALPGTVFNQALQMFGAMKGMGGFSGFGGGGGGGGSTGSNYSLAPIQPTYTTTADGNYMRGIKF